MCEAITTDSTGVDLDEARCGDARPAPSYYNSGSSSWINATGWRADVTATVRKAVRGTGPTGTVAGFAIGHDDYVSGYYSGDVWHEARVRDGDQILAPELHMVYTGYPVPRPLTVEQTFGCACGWGTSPTNQALAGDPVNTATGALLESFSDFSMASVGQPIDITRTYNSLDTTNGPFGPGWAYAYGASLREVSPGQFTFRDGTGTQSRYAAMLGGGYAPLDAAVSAALSDGPAGTHVMRNLSGATMTFDATGALIASADERGQGMTLAYSGGKLATVTDALGQSAAVAWDTGTGTNARIASMTASDGRVVKYTYATTAGAKRLTAVNGIDAKITKYAYDTATGGLSKITDPLGHVRAQNTYDPVTKRITKQLDQTGAQIDLRLGRCHPDGHDHRRDRPHPPGRLQRAQPRQADRRRRQHHPDALRRRQQRRRERRRHRHAIHLPVRRSGPADQPHRAGAAVLHRALDLRRRRPRHQLHRPGRDPHAVHVRRQRVAHHPDVRRRHDRHVHVHHRRRGRAGPPAGHLDRPARAHHHEHLRRGGATSCPPRHQGATPPRTPTTRRTAR